MKPDDIDFTATCELEVKSDHPRGASDETSSSSSTTCWCHGIVLWFETGFTDRFCRETPVVLSTSPYTQSTHWSQTIFTFQEPIAMTSAKDICDPASSVGTDGCPAVSVRTRISIARSSQHRSIDISVETTGVSCDGRKKSWPVQMFNL